ncbi:MAG: CDP-glucose 4,6-dehydratase [Sulfuritalea sp.]|nr:CDP-glucose 4,6-dehydratase [Sulfuritalea sp.]MDP1984314.1 CDP-glucose 4,6-dehydratase [Sulfuritalea sp.]
MNPCFWKGRRVFLTGHTGFKGAWLALWLQKVGAEVTAFSLAPPTQPNLFESARVAQGLRSIIGDIRDYDAFATALRESQASIVFHLAAQAVVAEGYRTARDTFATNLTGTVNLLDAIRDCPTVEAAVIVTSDKCYMPSPEGKPLHETDPLGGKDPYSASKSCAEIATTAWRESFFHASDSPRIATARAGNVIGGGDWASHRLLPDLVRAFAANEALVLRMPDAIRPWQHVLEAVAGYLLLAQHLCANDGTRFARSWNFGPIEADHLDVGEVAQRCAEIWGGSARIEVADANFQKETWTLRLDASQARKALGWHPRWSADEALQRTLEWYRAWYAQPDDTAHMHALTLAQIDDYTSIP